MNRLALKTKLIAVVVTGGVVLSSGNLAFASSNSKGATTSANAITQSHKFGKSGKCSAGMGAEFETQLKAAVTANVITQEESDKILAYKATLKENEGKTAKPDKYDMFSALVTNNIITQAKADALKANLEEQRTTQEKQDIDTQLKAFVADKTITQDQADKIAAAITADEASEKIVMAKVEAMIQAQREAYFDNLKADKVSPLDALVTNGTITQAQADKLGTLLHEGGMEQDGIEGMRAEFETQLKVAVTANVITQEESDKILDYKTTSKEDEAKPVKQDIFSALVTNNIITQAKADALKANFQEQRTTQEKQNLDTKLKAFVTDKTITEDQATKISAALIAAQVNPLDALVADGTITQAQADQLAKLTHNGGMRHHGERGNDVSQNAPTTTPAVKQ